MVYRSLAVTSWLGTTYPCPLSRHLRAASAQVSEPTPLRDPGNFGIVAAYRALCNHDGLLTVPDPEGMKATS